MAEERGESPQGTVQTGSIGSTVDLDFDRDLVHKVYHPPLKVRLLYALAFQAPFPYVSNTAALEAARHRRMIVDLLTKFWFGHHLVARVVDVKEREDGSHDFVTRLVRGKEPERERKATEFLKELDKRFLESGLPTWQVTPYNPHAITNFIERPDGSYRIIDLESSLVALLYPVSQFWRLMREGLVPSFDDINTAVLREYIARHGGEMEERLGEEYPRLLAAVDDYERAAKEWHDGEPRVINRALSAFARAVEWAVAAVLKLVR